MWLGLSRGFRIVGILAWITFGGFFPVISVFLGGARCLPLPLSRVPDRWPIYFILFLKLASAACPPRPLCLSKMYPFCFVLLNCGVVSSSLLYVPLFLISHPLLLPGIRRWVCRPKAVDVGDCFIARAVSRLSRDTRLTLYKEYKLESF